MENSEKSEDPEGYTLYYGQLRLFCGHPHPTP